MTERVGIGKLYREGSAVRLGIYRGRKGFQVLFHAAELGGTGREYIEHGFRAAHRAGDMVRLRQVPPVIAAGYAVPVEVCFVRNR